MTEDSSQGLPPDLADERTSINSIYNADTLSLASNSTDAQTAALILTLPQTPLSLLIQFPSTYPATPPVIDRVTHIDDSLPKGFGSQVLSLARDVLEKLTSDPSQAGTVVIYELIENLESKIAEVLHSASTTQQPELRGQDSDTAPGLSASRWAHAEPDSSASAAPRWILSEPLISHKSTFLARACTVSSPDEAHAAVAHLLATEKRAAKATHNMWAYRIRGTGGNSNATAEIVYADADDDGEDGAGVKLAGLLQAMGAWGILVVVSRWYGGVKLGPERWRLIGNVGREVLIKGSEAGQWQLDKMVKG